MEPDDFHGKLDQRRLVAAIADAERGTGGRIYVYVSHRHVEDAMERARARFRKLGLGRIHDHRASALIYLAPLAHKFAIVGDSEIHARCGETFWNGLASDLGRDLKAGDITTALLNAVTALKREFHRHFAHGGQNL